MNIMEETLKNVKVLKGWKGLDVIPEVEEKPEDIWMLIKYSDHGDDFLIVGTRDGKKYSYALYENRKYSEFNEYLRRPNLYKKLDTNAKVSNEIYFKFEEAFKKSHMSFGYDLKCFDVTDAQRTFIYTMEWISELVKTSDTVFDYNDKKRDILWWLKLNEIDTEENKRLLEETRFDNKVGEHKVIGVSGKMDISRLDGRVVDDVDFIIINRKKVDPDKILTTLDYDEWGYEIKHLSFKGFQPSKVRA